MTDVSDIRKRVKKSLDHPRYEHTKGVMYTAAALAMAYGGDIDQALVAGLLHDCAKCLTDEEKICLCEKNNVPISDTERQLPTLLHAKAGALLAKKKYKVDDPLILHAIEIHTTGAPHMNLLDKILFTADYIEPGRDRAPHLYEIRKLAFSDLDAAVLMILSDTLSYLQQKGGSIDPTTQETYDYYRNERSEREKEEG